MFFYDKYFFYKPRNDINVREAWTAYKKFNYIILEQGKPMLSQIRKGRTKRGASSHHWESKLGKPWQFLAKASATLYPSWWIWVHLKDMFHTKALQLFHLVWTPQGTATLWLKARTTIKESLSSHWAYIAAQSLAQPNRDLRNQCCEKTHLETGNWCP